MFFNRYSKPSDLLSLFSLLTVAEMAQYILKPQEVNVTEDVAISLFAGNANCFKDYSINELMAGSNLVHHRLINFSQKTKMTHKLEETNLNTCQ